MSNVHILALKRGEEIVVKLLEFCKQKEIRSAWVSGIGAASHVSLANYDLERKAYARKELTGRFEIASLTGNISIHDDDLVAHLHVVIGDQIFCPYAGHLDRAIVSATCELYITEVPVPIIRERSEEIGLNLIS